MLPEGRLDSDTPPPLTEASTSAAGTAVVVDRLKLRAEYLTELDWLTEYFGRRWTLARRALFSAALLALLLIAAALIGGRLGLKSDQLLGAALGLLGLAAVAGLALAFSSPSWIGINLQTLNDAKLAERIEAGLLLEHARARDFLRNFPSSLQRLAVGGRREELRLLVLHLELYISQRPISLRWSPLLTLLAWVVLAVLLILGYLLTSKPGIFLVPLAYACLCPWLHRWYSERAGTVAECLRSSWGTDGQQSGPAEFSGLALAEVENRVRLNLDVLELERWLQLEFSNIRFSPHFGWYDLSRTAAYLVFAAVSRSWIGTGIAAIFLLVYLAWNFWMSRYATRYRERLNRWLEAEDIMTRVALEDLTEARILERLPYWLHRFLAGRGGFLSSAGSGMRHSWRIVACNASWLEGGLRPLLNPAAYYWTVWLPVTALSCLGIYSFWILNGTLGSAGHKPLDAIAVMLLPYIAIGGLFGLPIRVMLARRHLGAQAFVDLLRAHVTLLDSPNAVTIADEAGEQQQPV